MLNCVVMRIAMIGQKGLGVSHTGGGGIERHVEELASRLVALGHSVTVYGRHWYTGLHGSMHRDGVRQVSLPSVHTKHADTITNTFLATVHAIVHGYDVFHYHGVGPALLSWIPRIFAPRAMVAVTFHSVDRLHQKWGAFARFILTLGEWAACRFPHTTIVPSRSIERHAQTSYGASVAYIPYGVPSTPSIDVDIQKGVPYILAVSRLVPHKGIHTLVEAYNALLAQGVWGKISPKLVIAGDGSFTDEYVETLHAFAAANPNILFLGHQNQNTLAELYAGASLFVHPSLSEGLPHVVLEAESNGAPVLVSDIAENKEAVGAQGWTFRAGDVEDLKVKMKEIFSKSPEVIRDHAKEGRVFVARTYGWDRVVKKIEAVYLNPLALRYHGASEQENSLALHPRSVR